MHRFYIPNINVSVADDRQSESKRQSISIDGPVARQLRTVLRAEIGDRIQLFDGTGSEWEVEIDHIGKGELTFKLITAVRPAPEPSTKVTLLLGLARPERIELAIQKCTELGAAAFLPVNSERVQGGNIAMPSANRLERWQRIAIEAAEQSGRATVPSVEEPVPIMDAVVAQIAARPLLCMWEEATDLSRPLKEVLKDRRDSSELAALIGPPGGFSQREATEIERAGADLVTLGPRVLRSETAAITVMSAILYELGDLGG